VGTLEAFDLSTKALERARQTCAGLGNVSFFQRDLADGTGDGDGDYDLILCSEILYYLRDRAAIAAVARRLADALRPGGHVLMANPNMVSDDKESTGFDFNTVGARSFAAIFSSTPGLEYVRELRTDLYRIQLFRRRAGEGPAEGRHAAPSGGTAAARPCAARARRDQVGRLRRHRGGSALSVDDDPRPRPALPPRHG
jgi:SAM-dependent methyltransferase